MSNKIKISVILPSLNVEEYVEECILSVITQTLQELEIICVDASSSDGTLDILRKYAQKDSRIILLNSDKKSYGHQVNLGMSKAKGEYISIIETDDFIEKNMLESLYNLSNNGEIDIVKGNFYHYNDSDKNNLTKKIDDAKKNLPSLKKFNLKENPIFIDGHPSIWAGIYRREFLEINKINMMEVPHGGWVDNPFFYETAIAAESIIYTNQPFYYYRISNQNSSSNNLNDYTIPLDRILDMFKIMGKYKFDDEASIVKLYNRLFRYIEIILENNGNTDKDLDYATCLKIHEVVEKVDEKIVKNKLKFNYQKMYYKYNSPLFLARFKKPSKLSKKNYNDLFKENEFLYSNMTYFRNQYNTSNYENAQLEKKYNETIQLLNITPINLSKKPQNKKISVKSSKNINNISNQKNKTQKVIRYEIREQYDYPLSVIIPVFNGAEFLEKSMNSLLKQTLDTFEIVFINDGSTDNSLEILKKYETRYDFVKVLTQENSGSGKARNLGINEARGKYIAFLDADDFFIDDDALDKIYSLAIANDANMVTANIKNDLKNEGEFVPFESFPYYTSNDVILPEQYGLPLSFYKNIYKRDFLVKNKIYFPNLLRGQDSVFLAKVLTKIDKIYVAATDLYAHVHNSKTSKANDFKKIYDQLLHYKMVIDQLNLPRFSRHRNEYFYKIMIFCSRLNDERVVDAIESIREIFKDMPDFLRRMENYIYLKFNHITEVDELIPWTKISVIMEVKNSEKLFEKSINSLINQTISGFELILIGESDDEKFEYIKYLLKNETWVKFLEFEKNHHYFRKIALNESTGEYIYFCDDNYVYEEDLLEKLLESSIVTGSEITMCNIPKGGLNNKEINFRSILGDVNFETLTFNHEKIMPHIFSSTFDSCYSLYKKSFLDDLSIINGNLIDNQSSFQIKSILNSLKLSFVPEFLFKHLKKNNNYYNSELPKGYENALNIFEVCDELEGFLKEKSIYEDFKTSFDIYKINQIASLLDYVRFVGCYSYNNPKNRDLYANNDKILDYSQYYGSQSEHVGLNYSYANKYFNKTKKEFTNIYMDLGFFEIKTNKYIDENNLNKFFAVIKADTYDDYLHMVNFSKLECLKTRNAQLKTNIHNKKSNNSLKTNLPIENELKILSDENKELIEKHEELRSTYWEYRKKYDYIISSRSWKYTQKLRKN